MNKNDATKLTLRLERRLIGQAKAYARKRETSLSKMVADYFNALVVQSEYEDQEEWKESLGEVTSRLIGRTPSQVPTERDYRKHLEEKHM